MSAATAPEAPRCVLGFDVGARRTGVAVGNTLSGTARALTVLACAESLPNWDDVSKLLREWQPDALLVGEPLTLEGEEQLASRRARAFAEGLRKRYDLPVAMVDERSTSKEADRRFAARRKSGELRRHHAATLDAVAAEIIVERWLRDHTLS